VVAHIPPLGNEIVSPRRVACGSNGVYICPQAWHLSRRNVVQNDGGVERLLEGVCAHRDIGTRTDRLRAIELACRVLIVVLCGLAAIVLTQLISGGALRLP